MTSEWISVSTPYLTPRSEGTPDPWIAETAAHGQTGSQRLLSAGEALPPAAVAEALGVPGGEPVVLRRRLMLLDEQPVEITNSYYPRWLAAETALAEPRKIRGGAVTLLAELGHTPQRVREDVEARTATPEERELLSLGSDAPVLVLYRLVLSDRPVEFSVMTMVAANRRLRYELTA
jgi:DNA-binding GntR family transcriptional regulator